jgi:hypothetical protein
MRATHYTLLARVYALNEVLGRSIHQFESKIGEPTRFTVGHFNLTHDSLGYTLEEQVSEAGGVDVVACNYTAHEMDVLIMGIMKGIVFRNIQIAKEGN